MRGSPNSGAGDVGLRRYPCAVFTRWIRLSAVFRLVLVAAATAGCWSIAFGAFGSLVVHATLGADAMSGTAAAAALSSPSAENDYVDIAGAAAVDTGARSDDDDEIVALSVGGSILLVKVADASDAIRFRGRTEALDVETMDAVSVYGDARAAILPVMLDATTDWRVRGVAVLVVSLLVSAGAFYVMWRLVRGALHPESTKSVRDAADPQAYLAEVDADLAAPDALTCLSAVVGSKYLFIKPHRLIPLTSVVWVYRKVVTTKVYGVLPVARRTEIVFAVDSGKQHEVGLLAGSAVSPENLATRIPWALIGFSEQRKAGWAGGTTRNGMISSAAARRDGTAPSPSSIAPTASVWSVPPPTSVAPPSAAPPPVPAPPPPPYAPYAPSSAVPSDLPPIPPMPSGPRPPEQQP